MHNRYEHVHVIGAVLASYDQGLPPWVHFPRLVAKPHTWNTVVCHRLVCCWCGAVVLWCGLVWYNELSCSVMWIVMAGCSQLAEEPVGDKKRKEREKEKEGEREREKSQTEWLMFSYSWWDSCLIKLLTTRIARLAGSIPNLCCALSPPLSLRRLHCNEKKKKEKNRSPCENDISCWYCMSLEGRRIWSVVLFDIWFVWVFQKKRKCLCLCRLLSKGRLEIILKSENRGHCDITIDVCCFLVPDCTAWSGMANAFLKLIQWSLHRISNAHQIIALTFMQLFCHQF